MSIIRRCAAITLAAGLAVTAAAAPVTAAPVNNQAGLVNVNVQLTNIEITIPIAAAVALCGTNVTILGLTLQNGTETTCDALATATG